MKYWLSRAALFLAFIVMALTFLNASWLAPKPVGAVKLVAHRGVAQQFSRVGMDKGGCSANRIERPVHDYIENTTRSMSMASRLGGDMIEMDVAPTADGRIAIFHDWTLDCKTDGHGDVRSKTLAGLKALDVGYGYTADAGKSFPLRGLRKDMIPSLEEALGTVPNTPILYNFKSDDPAEADRLFAALTAARRNVEEIGDAFYGPPAPVARMKQHYPRSWSYSLEAAKRCTKEYLLTGWIGHVPESCRDGVIIVPINQQWLFWGWPNRLAARMNKVGAKLVVTGPYHRGVSNAGLTLPEQLGDVPSTFKGYIWVEDIWTVGPALRPNRDVRTEAQQDAASQGLARRRASGQ